MPEPNDNLSEDFAKAMEAWRRKYQLREDDPLLLCLELFRIHQDHWDDIRRKDVPSFAKFRDSLKRTVTYSENEEHKIKPHKLRNLRDHECVLVHCEKGFRRVTLAPLEAGGRVSPWFKRSWL